MLIRSTSNLTRSRPDRPSRPRRVVVGCAGGSASRRPASPTSERSSIACSVLSPSLRLSRGVESVLVVHQQRRSVPAVSRNASFRNAVPAEPSVSRRRLAIVTASLPLGGAAGGVRPTDPCAPLSPCAPACRPLRLTPLTLVDAGDSYPLAPARSSTLSSAVRGELLLIASSSSVPEPRSSLRPSHPPALGSCACRPLDPALAINAFASPRPNPPRRCPARARPAGAAGCRPYPGRACGRVALPSSSVAVVRPSGVEHVALAAFGVT